jgi:hypothetical protein
MLEKARTTTRRGKYTYVQYARFADDMVILIDSHPRNDWLMKAHPRDIESTVQSRRWPRFQYFVKHEDLRLVECPHAAQRAQSLVSTVEISTVENFCPVGEPNRRGLLTRLLQLRVLRDLEAISPGDRQTVPESTVV